MTLVIGTDEAAYGPNLGPLVVAATAWRVDAPPNEAEDRITAAAEMVERSAALDGLSPLWGDSKEIYRAGAGMDPLERGVLVATAVATGAVARSWSDLERMLGPLGPPDAAAESPEWSLLASARVPDRIDATAADALAARIRDALAAHGVQLVAVRCHCVYAGRFNRELDRGLNKSDILSRTTLDLAASLAASGPDEPLVVWCDRHGGRKRYAGVVTEAFAKRLDGGLVRPLAETASRSDYALGASGRIEFAVGGESRTPVAVASMTAKYVRERAMACFNTFWSARQPGLLPTAGYPLDAKRWREDARGTIEAADVPPQAVWRRA